MALAIGCSPWAEFAASGPVLGLPGRQKVDDNLTSGSQTSGGREKRGGRGVLDHTKIRRPLEWAQRNQRRIKSIKCV
jgi:hypothetical protein